MRQGILVIGPESSGTRLLTRVLMAGGCDGDGDHYQRFDQNGPPDRLKRVVWRRSVPHDGRSVELAPMVQRMLEQQRRVAIIVIARHPVSTEGSQTGTYTSSPKAARHRVREAWQAIFRQLSHLDEKVDVIVFPYESLLAHPQQSQRALWHRLQLPGGHPVEIKDRNEQHYRQAAAGKPQHLP